MALTIKFLGGVRTVTGSSHLILTPNSKILLDAGLFYGRRDEFYQANTELAYNPAWIDAVILSHAHIDHCGNLPTLIKKGLRCRIYTTSATKDLCKLMLEDSGKVQEEDIKYLNKINKRLGLPLRKPLYTKKEAVKAIHRFRTLSYLQKFRLTKDIYVTLYDAGHILGASIIVLDIKDGIKNVRIGYAVDLGRKNSPLLNNPVVPKNLDYLILESTYGARIHPSIEEAKQKLKETINRTIERRGKVIIPSFALERTQEVIYFLNELLKEGAIEPIPIYIDSPLATDITEVFKYHTDYLNPATHLAIKEGKNPFTFLNLHYIRDQKESKSLNNDRRPMVIIAGSGMCESGRILHHLKNNIEDTRNTILVVGYMAKDTLGKRIVDEQRLVRIFGIEYELNAEVVVINAFSGHADKNELKDFVLEALPLKWIFLVHGDEDQSSALANDLIGLGLKTYIPFKNEEVHLD